MINLIMASTFEHVIGKNNKLPWYIKEELEHFKNLTVNNVIIMGRKTFESLPGVLPNRKHIILTKDLDYKNKIPANINVEVAYKSQTLIDKYFNNKKYDCWIIGGSEIFKIFIPYANNLHVSWILKNYDGDTYLPQIDWNKFKLIQEVSYDKFIYREYKKEF